MSSAQVFISKLLKWSLYECVYVVEVVTFRILLAIRYDAGSCQRRELSMGNRRQLEKVTKTGKTKQDT